MRRTWTIIGVSDVPGSFKWYQSLLGLAETAPAHDDFGQILESDGTVLLCLHEWGAHEHPSLIESRSREAWQRPPVVFPCGRFRHGPAKGTRSRHSARRGAPHEPEHRNYGVLAPRSGRVLCHDQCALCGLNWG